MCAIYCWACKDYGTIRTWGGEVPCLCISRCENCGQTDATAKHRHSCRPWPTLLRSQGSNLETPGPKPGGCTNSPTADRLSD